MLKQWVALKVSSDWLVKLHCYLPPSNFGKNGLSENITQINDEAVPENTKKATKFGLVVFNGNGLIF